MVCQCVKGHMGRGAVPGKASEHSNLQRLNLSLMHVFWFDPSSYQQSMWNHWPYQKLGISHMWSTGGKVCQNVSRRAPLFPAPQEASFCFQLRKWLMTVCRVQVSMCSQLWPWTPINWPAPTLHKHSLTSFVQYLSLHHPVVLSTQHSYTAASTC